MKPQTSGLGASHKALIGAIVLTIVLSLTPFAQLLMYPFFYLNTHIHELCHALVSVGTGGRVQTISVYGDTSGVTYFQGGNAFLAANAGYLGATIVGILIIVLSASQKSAQWVLRTISVVLGLSMILWVRGDLVGILSGLGWTIALFALSIRASDFALAAAQFVGVQQCLNGLRLLHTLFFVSTTSNATTDATILARMTFIPAPVWAFIWSGLGLVAVIFGLKIAWNREDKIGRAPKTGLTPS